jgi:hypothetical protein
MRRVSAKIVPRLLTQDQIGRTDKASFTISHNSIHIRHVLVWGPCKPHRARPPVGGWGIPTDMLG